MRLRSTGTHFFLLLPIFVLAGLIACACFSIAAQEALPVFQQRKLSQPQTSLLQVPTLSWSVVIPGLELGIAEIPESRAKETGSVFVFLRIDPVTYPFSLHMASETGASYSLVDWSLRENLRAGINASMYLPDNITSTGYMRRGDVTNNARIGGKLGAFFVAGRRVETAEPADIIEKDSNHWRTLLDYYDIVVQNYRLISSEGKVLWSGGGPENSIAAIAKDARGRIIFTLCQEPLTAERFALYLKSFPLALKTVMYVEGGAQAGLFLRLDNESNTLGNRAANLPGAVAIPLPDGILHVWKGRQNLLKMRGNPNAILPNILGISR